MTSLLSKIYSLELRRSKSKPVMGIAFLEDRYLLDGLHRIMETNKSALNKLSGMVMTASFTRKTYAMQANLHIAKVTPALLKFPL